MTPLWSLLGLVLLPAPGLNKDARLERDRRDLRAAIERRDALPYAADWLLEVELFFDPPTEAWFRTSDAWLPRKPLAHELRWGRPAAGRTQPFATDLEAPGHPYACITDVARQLAEHEVELLVVPVPTRLQVYPELILSEPPEPDPDRPFPGLAPGHAEFLLALSEAGIEVVDLLTPLAANRFGPSAPNDQAFLKFNMHWTPRAALAAASAVHERLTRIEGFEHGELVEGRDFVLLGETLPWAPDPSRRLPPNTVPEELGFVRVLTPDGQPTRFEDLQSPLLVIGDSYVTHFSLEQASFVEHLSRLTRQRLDVVALKGSGSLQTRSTLARRKRNGILEKRIVVWLFSVVHLSDEREWRPIEFPAPR